MEDPPKGVESRGRVLAGSPELELPEDAGRQGGGLGVVDGNVADHLASDGGGRQAAQVDAGLGQRRGDRRADASLVGAFAAQAVQARGLLEAGLLC